MSWGNQPIKLDGLGSHVAQATSEGNFGTITLGVGVMSLYVAIGNRILWRPLYRRAERKLRLG